MTGSAKLTVSASPHVKSPATVTGIMLDVIIALIPAAIAGIAIFGLKALAVIAVCVCSCVLFEYLSRKILKRSFTLGDLSAVVTGLLLALNLPASMGSPKNLWMCVFGSLVAIVVVKQLFGGLGQNFANPAITARIVMLVSFAGAMAGSAFDYSLPGADAVTTATPLSYMTTAAMKTDINGTLSALTSDGSLPSLGKMFLGIRTGCIGEVCAAALLIGAAYLIWRGVIKPWIPLCYIGTFAVLILIYSGFNVSYTLYEVLGGGLILGAFFMATDYTTSPINTLGKIVFGCGCGILTFVIRQYGSLPEGVSYSILLMNIACPLIEKATKPVYFGFIKQKKNKEEKTV